MPLFRTGLFGNNSGRPTGSRTDGNNSRSTHTGERGKASRSKSTDKLFAFRRKMSAAVAQIEARPEYTGEAYPSYGTNYPWQQTSNQYQYSPSAAHATSALGNPLVTPYKPPPAVPPAKGTNTAATLGGGGSVDDWKRACEAAGAARGESQPTPLSECTDTICTYPSGSRGPATTMLSGILGILDAQIQALCDVEDYAQGKRLSALGK